MPRTLLLVLLCVGRAFAPPPGAPASSLQLVLTTVLNTPQLAPYLAHYLCRQPVYFRLLPATAGNATAGSAAERLMLRVGECPSLRYNTALDARRYPVVTVQVLHLSADSARVRIGLPIEGVVGHFTLRKTGAWVIQKEQVVEL